LVSYLSSDSTQHSFSIFNSLLSQSSSRSDLIYYADNTSNINSISDGLVSIRSGSEFLIFTYNGIKIPGVSEIRRFDSKGNFLSAQNVPWITFDAKPVALKDENGFFVIDIDPTGALHGAIVWSDGTCYDADLPYKHNLNGGFVSNCPASVIERHGFPICEKCNSTNLFAYQDGNCMQNCSSGFQAS
jgi:hypothetical protein